MSSPSIADQYASIIAEWKGSSQRKALLNVIQTKLLTLKTMHIESALCLGLGSLEHAKLFPRLKWPTPQAETQVNDTDMPDSWEGDTSDEEPDIESCPSNIKKTFRNQSLYQLVVFETTLECLREKLKIVDVYFQDPKFSNSDVTFLEKRGHKVLPYTLTPGEQSPIDPLMLKNVNGSTFLFAPALDIPVLVEVLCTRKPGLLLSEDPLECLAYPVVPSHQLLDFETLVSSCEFEAVPELAYKHFGFTWPLDPNNVDYQPKWEHRQLKAQEANDRRARWGGLKIGDGSPK